MIRLTFALAFAALAAAGPASAQTAHPSVVASDPETVADAVRAAGYQATLGTSPQTGNPRIETRVGGRRVWVFFNGCTNNSGCTNVNLSYAVEVTRKPTYSDVNDWNLKRSITKVSIDEDGDPVLTLEFWLGEPVSQRYVADLLRFYDRALADFRGRFVN